MRVVIVTGISGSGKSTALKALEDIGFFCIDNLPFSLIPKFLELSQSSQEDISKIAIMIDLRSRDLKESYFSELKKMAQKTGYSVEILFMDASDETVLRRFQATRRRHPWPEGKLTLPEAIQEERKLFAPIRKLSDITLDTSDLNVHNLRQLIQKTFKEREEANEMQVILYSFGYNFGIPPDADLVMDVRFLPNPFFVENLKDLPGNSSQVLEYLLSQKETQNFLNKFYGLLDYLIPLYKSEGKSYLTIAVGCTGGRHRSVAIIHKIQEYLVAQKQIPIEVKHRDIEK